MYLIVKVIVSYYVNLRNKHIAKENQSKVSKRNLFKKIKLFEINNSWCFYFVLKDESVYKSRPVPLGISIDSKTVSIPTPSNINWLTLDLIY